MFEKSFYSCLIFIVLTVGVLSLIFLGLGVAELYELFWDKALRRP